MEAGPLFDSKRFHDRSIAPAAPAVLAALRALPCENRSRKRSYSRRTTRRGACSRSDCTCLANKVKITFSDFPEELITARLRFDNAVEAVKQWFRKKVFGTARDVIN